MLGFSSCVFVTRYLLPGKQAKESNVQCIEECSGAEGDVRSEYCNFHGLAYFNEKCTGNWGEKWICPMNYGDARSQFFL